MTTRTERTALAILRVLNDAVEPLGAARISSALLPLGFDLPPRTIRFYLRQLDDRGCTRLVSRRLGREITRRGREELSHASVLEKVGLIAGKVDELSYRMSFRGRQSGGTIVVNVSLIADEDLSAAIEEVRAAFSHKLGMGSKIIIAHEGEAVGGVAVPQGHVAIGTICSVTLNGVLLHESIPVTSRFGGLLEIRDAKPVRFVDLIEYRGSTLDPLEVFILAGRTRVRDVARTGSGIIGASFREIPAVAVDDLNRIERSLRAMGLSGVLAIGRPNQPLFGIPVGEGRSGLVVIAGLNPVAAVHEAGIRVSVHSLAGLEDISRFRDANDIRVYKLARSLVQRIPGGGRKS